jgi:hypothetical protein
MDKGIRAYARHFFVEQNELRRRGLAAYTGPRANTVFRKTVILELIEQFGCTVAAAASHYNEALRTVRDAVPELVVGLGRDEDKKGGRKRAVAVAPAPTPCLLLSWNGVMGINHPELAPEAPF